MSTIATKLQNLLALIVEFEPAIVQFLISIGVIKVPTPTPPAPSPAALPINLAPAMFQEHVQKNCPDLQVEVDQTAMKAHLDTLAKIATK